MSGPDAMHDEMPGFFPGLPGGEHDEPLLDMLLERRPIPPRAPSQLHDLARLLAAAAGPAEPGDLAGEDAARAAFRRLPSPAGASHAAPRSARHRLTAWPARGKLPLAALAVAAAGLGSATAAYAGALPSPIQHFAHEVIGAPPPPDDIHGQPVIPSRSPTVAPPRASTPAARKTLRVSAAPSSPKPGSWQWSSRNPRYSPRPTFASCHPAPGPTQNLVRPTPTPTPTSNPRNLSSSPASASPGSGQHSGRSLAARPSASSWSPSPSGTSCPSPPG